MNITFLPLHCDTTQQNWTKPTVLLPSTPAPLWKKKIRILHPKHIQNTQHPQGNISSARHIMPHPHTSITRHPEWKKYWYTYNKQRWLREVGRLLHPTHLNADPTVAVRRLGRWLVGDCENVQGYEHEQYTVHEQVFLYHNVWAITPTPITHTHSL